MAAPLVAAAAAVTALAAVPLAAVGGAAVMLGGGLTQPAAGLSDAVPPEYRYDILTAAMQCEAITPDLLAAQIHAESGWNPGAVSPAGAQGIAQFMPGTWAAWGGDADGDGDATPFDPNDAIHAQGRLMCDLVERAQASGIGGDTIDLALAGYNAGWGAVQAHGGVPPYRETQDYIARIRQLRQTYQAPAALRGGPANSQGSSARMLAYADEFERLISAGASSLPHWSGSGVSHPVFHACLRNSMSVWAMTGGHFGPGRRTGINAHTFGVQLHSLGLLNPDMSTAPRGALLFWDNGIGGGDGHVAVADGRGNMLNNWSSGILVSHPIATGPSALGWVTPEAAFEVVPFG